MGAWVFGNGQMGSAIDLAVYVNGCLGPSINKSLVQEIFFQVWIISFTASSSTPFPFLFNSILGNGSCFHGFVSLTSSNMLAKREENMRALCCLLCYIHFFDNLEL